ncbi:MAG: methyltransferase [Chloroflexota bacterium]|nr:methyltransferase [Chloroflexota bacterium]
MKFFERQLEHLVSLIVLVFAVYWASRAEGVLSGSLYGLDTATWFWLAIAIPIAHQGFVWITWRAELQYSTITRTFGDRGFIYYSVVFMLLLIARPIAIAFLAVSNQGSLQTDPRVLNIIALVLLVPILYLFYSLVKYFGLKQALGIDHFDAGYRDKPLVRKGIFKYSNNSMYVFGLLILWLPGLLLASKAALLAALFGHVYIWVHYFTVELPDMRYIYGSKADGSS